MSQKQPVQSPPTTTAKNWFVHELAPERFLHSLPEHRLLMQILYNRGMRTPEEVSAFLASDDAVAENPFKIRDMPPAVERILKALERKETICVYGDFDADGVCSTALLVAALQRAGAQIGAYIPNRVDEGYGLNRAAIRKIAKQAGLMITVDCGIRSLAEITYAQELGMDVIVTDHHTIGAQLPDAIAVINPRRPDERNSFSRLAGAGVAYRVAQAAMRAACQHRWCDLDDEAVEEAEQSLLDFVAIGTVADMMPMLSENRSLVRRGLMQLNQTERPGLQELLTLAGLRLGSIDASAISFRLAPRINAAGRLASAQLAYRLLRTSDHSEGYSLASELESLNEQRRTLTSTAQEVAERQVMADFDGGRYLLTVVSPDIAAGVVGLVAGRLTDNYYRPVVVLEEGKKTSRGSARSIPEFDISVALDELSHLLVRHGGHARAAGFTVENKRIDEFIYALQSIAERELVSYPSLQPTLDIDVDIDIADVDWALLEQFVRLEPTGQDNLQPRLVSRNTRVRDIRRVGGNKHLKLILDAGPNTPVVDAIAFSQGEWANSLTEGSLLDVVYELQANEWQGRTTLQLNVLDMRYSS